MNHIHRLIQKVCSFVSISCLVDSLQRYTQEKIGRDRGGLLLDVKPSIHEKIFLFLHCFSLEKITKFFELIYGYDFNRN